jgi:hypothetical protein
VTRQGVLQPRYGGAQPARDRDADGVGRDRVEALGEQPQDRQRLQVRPVGLAGPAPRRAVDQERRAVEVADAAGRILAGLRELHVIDQQLAGRQRADCQLDRDDGGRRGAGCGRSPVTRAWRCSPATARLARTRVPARRRRSPGSRHEAVRRNIAEDQPEHVRRDRGQVRRAAPGSAAVCPSGEPSFLLAIALGPSPAPGHP